MTFPVETFELFQQFHSMLLFSSVPCCLVLVIGTNSNRKNGKENNAKTSSARGILAQHKDLISIRSARGKEILQRGTDPGLESASLGWGSCLHRQRLGGGTSPADPLLPPTLKPSFPISVNSNRLFAGVHFARTLTTNHAVNKLF